MLQSTCVLLFVAWDKRQPELLVLTSRQQWLWPLPVQNIWSPSNHTQYSTKVQYLVGSRPTTPELLWHSGTPVAGHGPSPKGDIIIQYQTTSCTFPVHLSVECLTRVINYYPDLPRHGRETLVYYLHMPDQQSNTEATVYKPTRQEADAKGAVMRSSSQRER